MSGLRPSAFRRWDFAVGQLPWWKRLTPPQLFVGSFALMIILGTIGLTQFLAVTAGADQTILSALARRVLGGGGPAYQLVQFSTLAELMVAANTTGGVTAKMISPQSIAVACAATGLVGKESELFRFTVKHSLLFAVIIGVITMVQAYWLPGMIPG